MCATTMRGQGASLGGQANTVAAIDDQLHAAILAAVGELGYEEVTIADVLERSGVDRGTFFERYPDKEACYLGAYDAAADELFVRLFGAIQVESDWQGRLRAFLAELLGFVDQDDRVSRAVILEVQSAGPKAMARRTAVMRRFARMIDSVRPELSDPSCPPAMTAEAIAGGIETTVRARLASDEVKVGPLLPELMHFAISPYLGKQAAVEELRRCQALGIAVAG